MKRLKIVSNFDIDEGYFLGFTGEKLIYTNSASGKGFSVEIDDTVLNLLKKVDMVAYRQGKEATKIDLAEFLKVGNNCEVNVLPD